MRTRGSVSEGSEDIMRTRGSVSEGSEDIMRTRGSVPEGSEDIMRTRGSVSEGSEDIMRTRGSVSEGSEDIMRTRGSVSEGSEDIMRTRGSVSEGSEDIMRTRGSVSEGSEDIMRTRGSVPEGSEDIMRTRGSVSVLHLSLMLLLLCWEPTEAIHPDCALVAQHMRAEEQCNQILKEEETNRSSSTGCPTVWDDIRCWSRAAVGQVVSVSCANVSQLFANNQGYIYRNCTEDGWSEAFPPYENACEFAEDKETEPETTYFSNFKQVYTAGYATSLISLISAIFVFTVFRKFHCTRNYIHINLFFSFILRASAVFIKDGVLFSDENLDHCFMSTASCKSAVAFFQFSILANYFWLLVEGMYLQTLLALTFVFQKKYFWWYILIGWGLPTTIISAWILTRNFYDNKGCWDDTDVDFVWWIIKAPITASLLVNFIIFINVIRILVQKLTSPGVGGNDTSHFKRLAKSTLLLIPLFGMHYMLFAFLPEATGAEARLFIELGVGSFQGFGVALLYCFLNGEVQAELKKRFWKWQTQNYLRYSKRRRTLFTESSTVTQISVLDKSSPKDQPGSETQALTHSVTATPNNVSTV